MKKGYFASMLLLCFFSIVKISYSAQIQSSIYLLVDVSGSYHYLKDEDPELQKKIYREAFLLIEEASSLLPKNISFKTLKINEFSSLSEVICEAKVERKRLLGNNKKSREVSFTQKQIFDEYLEPICLPILMKTRTAQATDIEGAINLTAELAKAETGGPIFLMILSDFFEYKSDQLPSFKLELDNFKVALIYRNIVNDTSGQQYTLTKEQVLKWQKTISDAGADKVFVADERSNYKSKALSELF